MSSEVKNRDCQCNFRVISNQVDPPMTCKITDLAENWICCTFDQYTKSIGMVENTKVYHYCPIKWFFSLEP